MAAAGTVAIFAILGRFGGWRRVGYIVEDVDDSGNRKVYGVDESGAGCVYHGGDGCKPIGSTVAEYALALHKAARGYDVYLTFFTPLSLISLERLKGLEGRISGEDVAELLQSDIIRRLRDVVRKSDEPLSSGVTRSLEETEPLCPGSGDTPLLALRTRRVPLSRGSITTLFVPIPARVTQKDQEGSTIFSFVTDLDDVRSIMSAWIMYVLRDYVRPNLAVVDTTHGMNYLAGLLEEEFNKVASVMPRGVVLRAQYYNTDPVVPPLPEDAVYKYHLLEARLFSSTRLTHSLPELAARLQGYVKRLEENLGTEGGRESVERGKSPSSIVSVAERVVGIVRGYAAPFFDNEVLLWGTVFAKAALRLTDMRELEQFSKFNIAVFIKKDRIVRVIQTLIPYTIKDIKDYDYARRLALLSSSLRGLRELLRNTLDVLDKALAESGVELLIDPLKLYEETENATKNATRDKVEVFKYTPPLEKEEGALPPEYPPAAYVLLRHALREDVARFRHRHFKGKEEEGVRPRNFIAHAGLSRGVVVDVGEEGGAYTVWVDPARLSEAATSLRGV